MSAFTRFSTTPCIFLKALINSPEAKGRRNENSMVKLSRIQFSSFPLLIYIFAISRKKLKDSKWKGIFVIAFVTRSTIGNSERVDHVALTMQQSAPAVF